MNPLVLMLIIFFAVLTQSVAGFGLGLVSMSLLSPLLGVQVAAPLVVLVAVSGELVLLLQYRQDFSFGTVKSLIVGTMIGIPLGVQFVSGISQTNEASILRLLGLVVSGYAIYALLNLRLPPIDNPRWGYPFGVCAGVLSGMFNTGGPPLIIYGTCRRWRPSEFKSNLQGIFLVGSATLLVSHALSGNFTPFVLRSYVYAIPAIITAMIVGYFISRRISPPAFRKLVLVLLVFIGLRLIFV